MFTKFVKSVAFAAACLFSVNSFAGLITDVEAVNKTVDWTKSVSWTHNILDQGFDLGSALSATLTIEFRDDAKDPWYAPFEIALVQLGNFDGKDGGLVLNPTVDWAGALGISSLVKLNADGTLFVKVTSTLGDFVIKNSILNVVTKDAPVSVPESSSLILFGLGLLGLGLMRRKVRA
ncbi:MAG: PEP-CTERM sorting domain-containing protein [Cellvibrio sp.]|uniref:PEP-CTERM sorting domain-containing protein n=1 Tax=Cellvibrio sp. TaxID=1965322 RepID=UPI0031A3BCF4